MKIKVSIELDIPESDYVNENGQEDEFSLGCVHQLVFDQFINFAVCQHLARALSFCREINVESISSIREIREMHSNWADILRAGEKTVKIENISHG